MEPQNPATPPVQPDPKAPAKQATRATVPVAPAKKRVPPVDVGDEVDVRYFRTPGPTRVEADGEVTHVDAARGTVDVSVATGGAPLNLLGLQHVSVAHPGQPSWSNGD